MPTSTPPKSTSPPRRSRPPQRGRRPPPRVTTSQSEFESKTIDINRVARMVAGGRRFRFRVLVAVGNHKGVVGIGVAKSRDIRSAVEKATRRAHTARFTVPRRDGTIPREILVKKGTARILMRPARPGHGVVAGGVIRTICDLAGITDISAKILSRSTNDLVNARATIAGLKKLAERMKVAEARKKLAEKDTKSEAKT